ncbi:MAG: A24 family peptidase [Pseudohongiellaceae bacterium]
MTILEILSNNPIALVTITLVVGLLVGSFLNVVIHRLPIMLQREWKSQCCEFLEIESSLPEESPAAAGFESFNLVKPASHCPHCSHRIRAWENIPVISYLILRGKCSRCTAAISMRYPAIELVTGLLSALVASYFGFTWVCLALLVFTWSLIALTIIDVDHQLLPDNITLPLLWLGLLVNSSDLGLVTLQDAVIGAMGGYVSLWLFYWTFKLITGKEGMGYGDFKLLAALGAWMGWQSLLPIVILSSLVGAVIGIGMIVVLKRDRHVPIPFGPYLAGAGFIMLIWGPWLSDFYLSNFVI